MISLRHLIDTHAHLSDLSDRDEVIVRAKKAGVISIIAVGSNLETSKKTLSLANEYPNYVYPGVGIHPTELTKDNIEESLLFIEENLHKCVVLGEIGLDYWREAKNDEPLRKKQQNIYTEQLKMANAHGLPVSVHGRGAWEDSLEIAQIHGPERIVFHWYSGPVNIMKKILDHGYYVSATPAVEYSRDHKAALKEAPIERIMLETDCPVYMRNRRKTTEPADVAITLEALAKLKDIDIDEIAKVTTRNAKTFFKI